MNQKVPSFSSREYLTAAFKRFFVTHRFSHFLTVGIPFGFCFPPLNKNMITDFKFAMSECIRFCLDLSTKYERMYSFLSGFIDEVWY